MRNNENARSANDSKTSEDSESNSMLIHSAGRSAGNPDRILGENSEKNTSTSRSSTKTQVKQLSDGKKVPWAGDKKARLAAFTAIQKKGENLRILDLRNRSSFTDYFLICSGMTDRQVRAIAEAIESDAKKYGLPVLSIEGLEDARWVLIDLGDVVAHIFIDAVRDFYDLERLWLGAPRVSIPEEYYLGTTQEFPEHNLN